MFLESLLSEKKEKKDKKTKKKSHKKSCQDFEIESYWDDFFY